MRVNGILKRPVAVLLLAAGLAGCFTVRETEPPQAVVTSAAGGADVSVRLQGFAAELMDYETVYATSLVYVPGYWGRRYYHPGYVETVQTSSSVPYVRPTDAFAERARELFEEGGFILNAPQPDYLVEVRFAGPFEGERGLGLRALWWLCTLFTYDESDVVWTARLRISDNRTGRLLKSEELSQRYDVAVWSCVPLLGPMAYDRTDGQYMKCWCLQALTDRACAAATAFLAGKGAGQ